MLRAVIDLGCERIGSALAVVSLGWSATFTLKAVASAKPSAKPTVVNNRSELFIRPNQGIARDLNSRSAKNHHRDTENTEVAQRVNYRILR